MEKAKPAERRLTEGQLRELEKQYQTVLNACPRLKNFDIEIKITRKHEASPFPNRETLLIGWKQIAEFLGVSEVMAISHLRESLQENGAIFYKKFLNHGPRRTQNRRFVCAFPSAVVAWSVKQSLGGRNRKLVEQLRRLLESAA